MNELDHESARPHVAGFIVKELSRVTSNWRSEEHLHDYLARHGVMGIEGIDTRAAVLHVRQRGAMRAVISTERDDAAALRAAALASPPMEGRNLVDDVTIAAPYEHRLHPERDHLHARLGGAAAEAMRDAGRVGDGPHVVAYDFGVKRNILDLLLAQGLRVTVVPARTTAEEVLALKPDGVFLSNGPGDPAALPGIVAEVRKLMGAVPMFGICLGHQILGLASGGTTYKLKFGHHGANHPVRDEKTNRVEITSQNHGFCVDINSLPKSCVITHVNLNDNTLEGFEDEQRKFFAVQYHPEAAPGPHDSGYLFRRFREWIERG